MQEFSMELSQKAYQEYCQSIRFDRECDSNNLLRQKLAIKLLSCICDEYLNKYEGDFIKIEMSEEIQR